MHLSTNITVFSCFNFTTFIKYQIWFLTYKPLTTIYLNTFLLTSKICLFWMQRIILQHKHFYNFCLGKIRERAHLHSLRGVCVYKVTHWVIYCFTIFSKGIFQEWKICTILMRRGEKSNINDQICGKVNKFLEEMRLFVSSF